MKLVKQVVEINAIEFDDIIISVSNIRSFLELAERFEDTIGEEGNYTNEYFYFSTKEEKQLEKVLLKLDVIRLSPNHKYHNDRVAEGKTNFENHFCYWLSDGYRKFYDDFMNTLYNKD